MGTTGTTGLGSGAGTLGWGPGTTGTLGLGSGTTGGRGHEVQPGVGAVGTPVVELTPGVTGAVGTPVVELAPGVMVAFVSGDGGNVEMEQGQPVTWLVSHRHTRCAPTQRRGLLVMVRVSVVRTVVVVPLMT